MRTTHRWSCIMVPLALALLLSEFLSGCGSSKTTFCQGTCVIHPGSEFVFATTNTGEVATLNVDVPTGNLSPASSVPGPQSGLGIAASGTQYLYASEFLTAQVYGYSIDSNTGALTAVAGSPFSTGQLSIPGGLAATPDGSALYAADAIQVDGFSINGANGILTALSGSPFPSGGSAQLAVTPSQKFLYGSFEELPGGVIAFSIGSTGALTPVPGSPFLIPGQTAANSRPFGVTVDPSGKFLFLAMNLTNQVAVFSIDQNTGILTTVPGSPFDSGLLPTLLVTTGKYLYVLNGGDQTISAYSVDSTSGVLSPVNGSPFAAGATAGMVLNAGMTSLYAAAPATNSIVGFTINSDGSLTPLSGSPFTATGAVLLTYVRMPSTGG